MKTQRKNLYVIYGLREIYHELGWFDFKVVLNPRFFQNSRDCELSLHDSGGRQLKYEVKRWGRKINCSFLVDTAIPDGVVRGNLVLKDSKGSVHQHGIMFWVIQ